MPDADARRPRYEDGDGVEIKHHDTAIDEEGKRVEKKRGGEMAVEELIGRARRAAGDAGQSGEFPEGAVRRREPRREPESEAGDCT